MKNLLLGFLLLPAVLSAQTYTPFISTSDSSDTWLDVNSCTDFDCYYTYKNRYTIDGDTLIGGLQYSKVHYFTRHEQGGDQSQWCTESVNYYDGYFGALRESEKKVFLIRGNTDSSSEYLAYDFNLTVGDTLPSPTHFGISDPENRIIESIDSVLVFGTYRKRYLISSSRFVIEGIGASTGLFNPLGGITSKCYFALNCYSENDISDYFTNDCTIPLNVNVLNQENKPAHLVRIVDYLGRETEYKPLTPLIYIYSDGTIKREFQVE